LKNAANVVIEGNLLEHNWLAAQAGYAVLLKSTNQNGDAPWSVVKDVVFRNNVVRHTSAGINIAREGRAEPTQRITIENNLFYDVDGETWGGNGTFLLVGSGSRDIVVRQNTVLQTGTLVAAAGVPIPGFRFELNLGPHNEYGVKGDNRASGVDTLEAYFPQASFRGNVIGGADGRRYPRENQFPPSNELDAAFVDPARGDFRLKPNSWNTTPRPGVDFQQLQVGLGPVMAAVWPWCEPPPGRPAPRVCLD
jgi:hypothetical protein